MSARLSADVISGLHHLPPLQPVAGELLTRLADEYASLADIVAILEQEPAISARLLGLANSALYNWPTPIESLQDAVTKVLGLDVARAVSLGILFSGNLDASCCPELDQQRLWSDSLLHARLTAGAVRCLPDHTDRAPMAYTGALLCRLGILALAHVTPARLNHCLVESDSLSPGAAIRLEFGFSHREVAVALARHWQLPEDLVRVMTLDPAQVGTGAAEVIECARLVNMAIQRFHEAETPLLSSSDSPISPQIVDRITTQLGNLAAAKDDCDTTAQAITGG